MKCKRVYLLIFGLLMMGFAQQDEKYPFLKLTGERTYTDSSGDYYHGLVMLLPISYRVAIREIRAHVSGEYGIDKLAEVSAEESRRRFEIYSGLTPTLRENKSEVESTGFNLDTIRQYEITSSEFNVVSSVKGFSKLELVLIDGAPILNRECSLFQLKRFDDFLWWGREFHTGCSIPFKVRTKVDIITTSEVEFVKDLSKILRIAMPTLINSRDILFYANPIVMKKLKDCVREQRKEMR